MSTPLIQEELMEIYKNPTHKGSLPAANSTVIAKNPFCGDELTVSLQIEDNMIKKARFDGSVCAVSVISASIFLEFLEGKTLEEARAITKEDLLNMVGLNLTTSRVACATLVLKALEMALKKYETK